MNLEQAKSRKEELGSRPSSDDGLRSYRYAKGYYDYLNADITPHSVQPHAEYWMGIADARGDQEYEELKEIDRLYRLVAWSSDVLNDWKI